MCTAPMRPFQLTQASRAAQLLVLIMCCMCFPSTHAQLTAPAVSAPVEPGAAGADVWAPPMSMRIHGSSFSKQVCTKCLLFGGCAPVSAISARPCHMP